MGAFLGVDSEQAAKTPTAAKRAKDGRTALAFLEVLVCADSEEIEDPLKVIVAIILDFDTALFATVVHLHVRRKVIPEEALEGADVGVGLRLGFAPGGLIGPGGIGDILSQSFGSSDGEGFLEDLVAGEELAVLVLDGEDGFGMSNAEAALCDEDLDVVVKFEKAHGIGDTGAGFADAAGDFFLLHRELLGEADVTGGFFDGVEVFALKVLNEGHFEHVTVGCFAFDDGHGGQAEFLRGPPATFSGDQFELITDLSDNEWLNDAVLPDGLNEFVKRAFDEVGAGLEWTGDDLIDRSFPCMSGSGI